MILRSCFILLLAAVLASCASSGKADRRAGAGAEAGPPNVNRPSALLARARNFQAREGCAKAAPTYRVVAGFGAGYEIAQYELGACLLEMEGDSDVETTLFRHEGLFWLNRAAWAGNPRAQLKLAEILSGASRYEIAHVGADPERAMVWASIYERNGARETYGLKPVGPIVTAHLQSVLAADAIDAAREEALRFRKIEMAEFAPPPQERTGERSDGQTLGRPPEGRRRRPR